MYTLRLFGAPFIEGPGGPLSGRASQKRRIALLAVLALAERRTLTRDRLASLFWPESDAGRARHNLADSICVIRKELGQEAISTPGDDVRLNGERVGADVEAFRLALEDGELERAVSLRTGPLMEGFHISDAPAFERWLDLERGRLETAHTRALEELVGRAEAEKRTADAAALARRLVATDPLNGRHALLLVRTLAAAGDRAGAVRHGEEHARRLQEELGLDPDPRVAEFVRDLKNGGAGQRVRPEAGPAMAGDDTAVAGGVESAPGRRAEEVARVPWTSGDRRPGPPSGVAPEPTGSGPPTPGHLPLAFGLAFGLALVLLGWFVSATADPAEAPVSGRIVVVPFENRAGGPEIDRLGRLSADVLIRALSRVGAGDVVLPFDMVGASRSLEGVPRGRRQAAVAAREFRAEIVVTGTIHRNGDELLLAPMILEDGGVKLVEALEPVPVDPSRPGSALESVESRVLGAIAMHLGQDPPEHPFFVRAPSYESYRMADRATTLFLEHRFDTAARLYHAAYERDSTAVGYLLWEGVSQLNLGRDRRVDEILRRIRPRRNELSRFDAAHVDWLEAYVRGDREQALAAARSARKEAPHSGLGGYQVAVELYRIGKPHEALEVFLDLDPQRGWLGRWDAYWVRLASVYHVLGRHEEELATAERGYERHPNSRLLHARIRALAALGRTPALRRALRESPDPPRHLLTASRVLHRHGRDSAALAVAEEGLRALGSPTRAGSGSAGSAEGNPALEARLLIAASRFRQARSVLLDLLEHDPHDRDTLGWLGFVEAKLGRESAARKRSRTLTVLDVQPYTYGHTVARAAIHAALGDDPVFVRALLEQSHREGWSLPYFHFTPLFDAVRDHPEVRDFFRLRG